MLAGMATDPDAVGEARQGETPDWAPLEAVLGSDELCAHFMWMFDVELTDGTILNAYKHRWTRRYLHLAPDGRAFWYVGDNGYDVVDQHTAIEGAFHMWECCRPTGSEKAALRAALRRARNSGL
jgi:hypothetical protein